MNSVRIREMRKTVYQNFIGKCENPTEHACDAKEGQQKLEYVVLHKDRNFAIARYVRNVFEKAV